MPALVAFFHFDTSQLEKKPEQTLKRGRLLYEGQSKRVFETNRPDQVLIEFKSEFPQREPGTPRVPAKPRLAAHIAEHVFSYLQSFRIPNHFIARHDDAMLLVKRLEMIPVAIVVRNIAAGSLCQKYGVTESRELEFPIVEMLYKNRQLDYPMVNESHVLAFGVSTPEEIRTMVRIAAKTNAVLRSFMERRRMRLVDLWVEFGRNGHDVLLADALIPDTMRILDTETGDVFDGSLFRLGIGNYAESYASLHKRLTT